jgi:hypothetical protein
VTRSRRDRHGRGLRGPLAPPSVPLRTSRSERFDALVVAAVQRVGRRWAPGLGALGDLQVVVTELPAADAPEAADGPVPLGSARPATPGRPARLVVHRRPVEARALGAGELERLVRDVVTEQLALLLGVPPEDLDPGWTRP